MFLRLVHFDKSNIKSLIPSYNTIVLENWCCLHDALLLHTKEEIGECYWQHATCHDPEGGIRITTSHTGICVAFRHYQAWVSFNHAGNVVPIIIPYDIGIFEKQDYMSYATPISTHYWTTGALEKQKQEMFYFRVHVFLHLTQVTKLMCSVSQCIPWLDSTVY